MGPLAESSNVVQNIRNLQKVRYAPPALHSRGQPDSVRDFRRLPAGFLERHLREGHRLVPSHYLELSEWTICLNPVYSLNYKTCNVLLIRGPLICKRPFSEFLRPVSSYQRSSPRPAVSLGFLMPNSFQSRQPLRWDSASVLLLDSRSSGGWLCPIHEDLKGCSDCACFPTRLSAENIHCSVALPGSKEIRKAEEA